MLSLSANVMVPGPVADQVYVRFLSPPSSPARTSRVVVAPRAGFGDATGGETMNGGMSSTVTVAVACTAPAVAVTVNEPMAPLAWNFPAASTEPPPLTDHERAGAGTASPN